jgi:hypothetical protein
MSLEHLRVTAAAAYLTSRGIPITAAGLRRQRQRGDERRPAATFDPISRAWLYPREALDAYVALRLSARTSAPVDQPPQLADEAVRLRAAAVRSSRDRRRAP